jgi:uncharacterized glyoxalase superfamily protein PhnB
MEVLVDLVVEDVETTARFYAKLGLSVPELWRSEDGVAQHVETPQARIGFNSRTLTSGYNSSWPGGSGVVLMFKVDSRADVDEKFAELTQAGYAAHMEPIDAFWGARYAIVDDPDGNHVGIMGPQDHPHT